MYFASSNVICLLVGKLMDILDSLSAFGHDPIIYPVLLISESLGAITVLYQSPRIIPFFLALLAIADGLSERIVYLKYIDSLLSYHLQLLLHLNYRNYYSFRRSKMKINK